MKVAIICHFVSYFPYIYALILDNLAKARAKAKQAEFDSEVNSEGDDSKAGKHKTKKNYFMIVIPPFTPMKKVQYCCSTQNHLEPQSRHIGTTSKSRHLCIGILLVSPCPPCLSLVKAVFIIMYYPYTTL